MAAKCSVTFAAVAILAVAMAMGSMGATFALTSWGGPGCSGQGVVVESCGCSDLQYYQGQTVTQDQTVTFYTETGCAGTPYEATGGFEGTRFCGDFGWRSVNIEC